MELYKEDIQRCFERIKGDVGDKLKQFEEIKREKDESKAFKELVFCLLTPQSKAEVCWKVVLELEKAGLLFSSPEKISEKEIENLIRGVRFKKNKTKYIILAKKMFLKDGVPLVFKKVPFERGSLFARKWLVKNVKGLGFKEASHFLRNIGFYEDIAILDRHILRCLETLGVIDKMPKTLTEKRYLKIERKMRKFSKNVNVPMHYLDFVFWYLATGRIFK